MVDSLKERLLPKSMSESIYSANATTRSGKGGPQSWSRQQKAQPVYEPIPEAKSRQN